MFTPPDSPLPSPLPSPRSKDEPIPKEFKEMQQRVNALSLAPPPMRNPYSSRTQGSSVATSQSGSSSSQSYDSTSSSSLNLSQTPPPPTPVSPPFSLSPRSSLSPSSSPSTSPASSSFTLSTPPLSSSSPLGESWPNEKSTRSSWIERRLHQFQEHQRRSERKRRIGRNLKWSAILIPIVLILVTLGNHYPGLLSGIVGWVNDKFGGLELEGGREWLGGGRVQLSASILVDHPRPTIFPRANSPSSSSASGTVSATFPSISASGTGSSASSSASTTATSTIPATAQALPTVPSSSPALPTPFPQPYESTTGFSTLSQNFSTQSCYNFFLNMTNLDSFRSCRSFGILNEASGAFVNLQSNLSTLNSVIWGTCNPPPGLDQCTSTMFGLAAELRTQCEKDLDDNNLSATQMLSALLTYSLTFSAGCLTDPSTDSYCYVKAAHASNPSDLYFYSLVSGIPMSNNTLLTCSGCGKSLMGLYVDALNSNGNTDSTSGVDLSGAYDALRKVYPSAQALSSTACGPSYAKPATGTLADKSNGARSVRSACTTFWMPVLGVLGFLLLT